MDQEYVSLSYFSVSVPLIFPILVLPLDPIRAGGYGDYTR